MSVIKKIAGWLLIIVSVLMMFRGLSLYLGTLGEVSGTEFGMLITLVNQLSEIMIWLALFAAWRLLPPGESQDKVLAD